MIDAAKYDHTATLRNGMPVKVRSIRPDDKKRLVTAFKNLDPESIYTRFFYHKKMLTEDELKAATELDFENAVALVVTTGDDDPDELGPRRHRDAGHFFEGRHIPVVVDQAREVIHARGVGQKLLVEMALGHLFVPTVAVADDGVGLQDVFTVELEEEPKHAMGAGVLGPHVQVIGLLDDRFRQGGRHRCPAHFGTHAPFRSAWPRGESRPLPAAAGAAGRGGRRSGCRRGRRPHAHTRGRRRRRG